MHPLVAKPVEVIRARAGCATSEASKAALTLGKCVLLHILDVAGTVAVLTSDAGQSVSMDIIFSRKVWR